MFSKGEMLDALGDPSTNEVVSRLKRLAHVPKVMLERLGHGQALTENWGHDDYVLRKYLAVHVAWSIEQDRYTMSHNQLFVTAGHLQTRYGTPLYLVFERNETPERGGLLYCVHTGADISAPELPMPPELPRSPEIAKGAEIIMLHDHILKDHSDRVPFLEKTPPVSQMCAISGAIQWSLNQHLEIPYWYRGLMNFLVPLYLQSREDITVAPDLIAPIQVNPDSLIVRTVLLPHMPYANARVAVTRHDQLPHWMLDAWNASAMNVSEGQIDDPEPRSAA